MNRSIQLIKRLYKLYLAYCYQNLFYDVCPLTSFGFFNLCTGVTTLCCCALTKDGGWEHPGHCCNAIKSGLHVRTKLGLITRRECCLNNSISGHYNVHYDFGSFAVLGLYLK